MTTYKPTNARYWCVTDLECTGLDPERHEIIQVARVVIDTVDGQIIPDLTMSEYIQPTRWDQRDNVAMKVNGLTLGKLQAEGISAKLALEDFYKLDLETKISWFDKKCILSDILPHLGVDPWRGFKALVQIRPYKEPNPRT